MIIILMLGGVWSSMLSHEQFTLGIKHEPIKTLLPGGGVRLKDDEIYQADRYLIKGVDDGAVWHRALPIPTAHWLADRWDATRVMGSHGLTAPATEAYIVGWLAENEPGVNPEVIYDKAFNRGVTAWIRSWEIDGGNLWRKDVALANGVRFGIWLSFCAVQSVIWSAGHREFFGSEFDKSNKIRRKKASGDAIGSSKVWEVAFNYIDMFYIALLLSAFVASYVVEFTLTGGLSPKLKPRWLFRLISVSGFEATFFVVTKLYGDKTKKKPLPPTKTPTKPQDKGKTQPKDKPKPQRAEGATTKDKTKSKPTWSPPNKGE